MANRPIAVARTSSTKICSFARSRKRATSAVSNARVSVRASAVRAASPRARVAAARFAPASFRRAAAVPAAASNASSAGADRVPFRAQCRGRRFERFRIERERIGGAGRDAPRFAGGAAQPRAPGRRDERCVERAAELAEAALRDQRVVVGEQAFGIFARREREDRRSRRVLRGLREDALRRGLPGLTARRTDRHAPQIDLGLDDEDRLDVAPDDPRETMHRLR